MMKLGFLGVGAIASAAIEGIAADSEHAITVSQRGKVYVSRLTASFAHIVAADNQTVVDRSDVLFLGSTADAAPVMLQPLQFRADQQVVSFMVGISVATLQALVAPAQLVTQMIPFPSIALGGSPILIYPDAPVVEAVFGTRNTVLALRSEADFKDYLAAQAVLSPVLKMLSTTSLWLGEKTGDSHAAEQFLRLLVGGSIAAAPIETRDVLADMLASLNTPGGLNAQLREYMGERQVYGHLQGGLDVLSQRLAADKG